MMRLGSDGKAYGGYADNWRSQVDLYFQTLDVLPSAGAAPMLTTVFSRPQDKSEHHWYGIIHIRAHSL